MLKTETQTLQKMVKDAIVQRDGDDDNFYVFDTICGATQDRQDALYELLKNPLDVMFVVGGYNSSNTTHLVDIAREHVPTYFIESAECIKSIQYVDAFDTKTREVRRMTTEPVVQNLGKSLKVGITAGASCPANLIEATILRIADLRSVAHPAEDAEKWARLPPEGICRFSHENGAWPNLRERKQRNRNTAENGAGQDLNFPGLPV
ncbi:MAG: hypothetical protein ACLT8E_02315 [Akkermansia sp.]